MKVLIVAQSPTHMTHGGAEVAAENLAFSLASDGIQVEIASAVPHSYSTERFSFDESRLPIKRHFIPSDAVHPYFINEDPTSVRNWLKTVEESDADVIHFHHFFKIGTNVLCQINRLQLAPVSLLTLHEYLAICLKDGQLVRSSGARCSERSLMDCLRCNQSSLNDGGISLVQTRHEIFKNLLHSLDHLVAPSNFLLQQFVDWGINPIQISQIPNVIKPPIPLRQANRNLKKRILFLSSLSKLKGIETFISAADDLLSRIDTPLNIEFEIWGSELPSGLDKKCYEILETRSTRIKLMGNYERGALDDVLSNAALVVCPSIWFENRPTILDEAAIRGIPTLASDIGGMKELANNPISSLFISGDSLDLAECILDSLSNEQTYEIGKLDFLDAKDKHKDLYANIAKLKGCRLI
jgi:glycosyltransferase involved in cell wall biosynthesis